MTLEVAMNIVSSVPLDRALYFKENPNDWESAQFVHAVWLVSVQSDPSISPHDALLNQIQRLLDDGDVLLEDAFDDLPDSETHQMFGVPGDVDFHDLFMPDVDMDIDSANEVSPCFIDTSVASNLGQSKA